MATEEYSSDAMVFGFQTVNAFCQGPKSTDILSVTYNTLVKRYIVVDGREIFSWSPSSQSPRTTCELTFPKYHNRMLRCFIFCEKYNVYFAICQDFTLQVYNKKFQSTCKVENQNMRAIQHLVFNSRQNELITIGIAGTTVWKYQQMTKAPFNEIRPMANYSLVLQSHHELAEGSWCTKVHLVEETQQLFFCCNTGLFVYDARNLKLLWRLKNAHGAALTSVSFWLKGRMLVTGGLDAEIKVWSSLGGHICTFRGHSRPITSIVVHPHLSGFVMTSSLDGTVKVWSLTMLEMVYSYNVFVDGVDWMDITPDGSVWCATVRQLSVFKFNSFAEFWGHTQCNITKLCAVQDAEKTDRILAVGDDGGFRLFRQSLADSAVLCTVLPPPTVSLDESVLSITYSRHNSLFFVLTNPWKIWVYTGKTDPACRLAEWDIAKMQKSTTTLQMKHDEESTARKKTEALMPKLHKHVMNRPSIEDCSHGVTSECSSLQCVYSSSGFTFHGENGMCSARSRHLLAIGLKDGRVLFVDQKQRGLKYFEMQISNGPVEDICVDFQHQRLLTLCYHFQHIIQVWKFPDLQEFSKFTIHPDYTSYVMVGDYFCSGYRNGSVKVEKLSERRASVKDEIRGIYEKEKDDWSEDHRAPVTDVKACPGQDIFCSCSSDGMIKIWKFDKILLNEIVLDDTLSSCTFINSFGDLLIGWKNHIFLIHHHHVAPQLQACLSSETLEYLDCESDIYEDPSIKYETLADGEEEPLTMQKYLVPYSFINVEDSDQMIFDGKPMSQKEESDTSDSEDSLHAPSDICISPASSYDCLTFLDSYPQVSRFQSVYDISDFQDISFPHFGISPGPTPSVSSESEIEIELEDYMDDVYDPIIRESEVTIDVAQQMLLAKNVNKAVNLMKPPVPEIDVDQSEVVEDERPSSRFANARIDARALMKVAVSAVIAANKFKSAPSSPRKARQGSAQARPKKQRKDSSSSIKLRRKSSTAVDLSTVEGSEVDSVINQPSFMKLDIKGKEMPFGKSAAIPARQAHVKDQRTLVSAIKSARHARNKGQGSAAKYKRKTQGSKSGSAIQEKAPARSSKGKTSSSTASTGFKIPSGVNKLKAEGVLGTLSDAVLAGTGGGVTQVQMRYKRPDLFKEAEENKVVVALDENAEGEKLPDQELGSLENATDDANKEKSRATDAEATKEFLQRFLRTSRPQTTMMNSRGDRSDRSEKMRPLTHTGAKSAEESLHGYHDDDYDPDRSKISDVLDFDLHAIYKKDGLRFDESWQERMLERYHLMKMQREQRHLAAASKRTMLERERKYKILTHRPELMYNNIFAWHEVHAGAGEYVMNSPLITGDTDRPANKERIVPKPDGPVSVLLTNRTTVETPAAAPPSVSETLLRATSRQDTVTPHSDKADVTRKYRFTFRRTSEDGENGGNEPFTRPSTVDSTALMTPTPTPVPPATPINVTNHRQGSAAVKSGQKFLVDRPRSSTSIPGKTRYVLVKSDPPHFSKTRTPSPTKLEEDLLKRRFPSQHQQLMRSLGKLDTADDKSSSDDDDTKFSPQGTRMTSARRRTSSVKLSSRSLATGGDLGDSRRRPSLRESAPAFLQPDARDTTLISVLHRKNSSYVPAAFKV